MDHLFQTPRTMAVLPSSNLDMARYFTRKRGFRGGRSQKSYREGRGGKNGGKSVKDKRRALSQWGKEMRTPGETAKPGAEDRSGGKIQVLIAARTWPAAREIIHG